VCDVKEMSNENRAKHAILLHKLSDVFITQLYIENKTSPKKN